MKINSNSLSFNGVILVGSVPQNKKETFDKIVENQNFASIIADSLQEQGKDVFVIDSSIKDAQGKITNRVNTYVLTGQDAKIVNKFGEIKKQLHKTFAKDLQSDIFTAHLDRKTDAISKEQMETAQFIAENKLNKAVEWSHYA